VEWGEEALEEQQTKEEQQQTSCLIRAEALDAKNPTPRRGKER
jgi:hypothetical protein